MKEIVEKSLLGIIGSGTGMMFAGTDHFLSIVASVVTIIFMAFSTVKIIQEIRKKK